MHVNVNVGLLLLLGMVAHGTGRAMLAGAALLHCHAPSLTGEASARKEERDEKQGRRRGERKEGSRSRRGKEKEEGRRKWQARALVYPAMRALHWRAPPLTGGPHPVLCGQAMRSCKAAARSSRDPPGCARPVWVSLQWAHSLPGSDSTRLWRLLACVRACRRHCCPRSRRRLRCRCALRAHRRW